MVRVSLSAAKFSQSEIIWPRTWHALQKIATAGGDDFVQSLSVVRDMGVLVDQELTFKQHVVSYF